MDYKRVTLLAGHYGSGKTNIAVSMALDLRRRYSRVAIADLDIVNPYFRTIDSRRELEAAGIRLIVSQFAETNLDLPALPQEMYAVTDDTSLHAVMDIGGDDRGALALGRYTPFLREEGDYEMLLVMNFYRPLTPDAASVQEVRQEIEQAGGLPFTGLINNSNLGPETTPETLLKTRGKAEEASRLTGLPLKLTTVEKRLYGALSPLVPDLFPITLQAKF